MLFGCIDTVSVVTQKKQLYVYSSLLSVFGLFGIVLNDLLQYTIFEKTERTSQPFTESLLMIHVLTYYCALLGFVYNTKAGKSMGAAKLEWVAVVSTFLLTITRLAIEMSFITYRKQAYKNFE